MELIKSEKTYEEIPFSDELFPLRILWNMGREDSTENDDNACSTWHEQLELLYFTQGSAEVICGFRRYVCERGDIVVINPCEAHRVRFRNGPLCYHCIMVDSRLYSGGNDLCDIKYIASMTGRRVHFNNIISGNTQARSFIEGIISECSEKSTAYEVAVKGMLLCLLAVLFRTELREVGCNESMLYDTDDYNKIAPALIYIAENYRNEIRLDDLAGCCCMNSSYFCRKFHAVTGRTAFAYLNEYRLSKAEAMLMSSGASISQVAANTGFSDGGYFSKKFRESRGCSPREYIRTSTITAGNPAESKE